MEMKGLYRTCGISSLACSCDWSLLRTQQREYVHTDPVLSNPVDFAHDEGLCKIREAMQQIRNFQLSLPVDALPIMC